MFAALSGVASFHRACLLAQDFTHEPACQTGDSAPQGRFRHQPEQMVHPPFAWQLASFPSLPVCGEEAPYCPLRDFATLRAYSPEIKAQQAIFAFLPVYPALSALVGSRMPDYRGIFLRGHGSQTSTHYGTVVHSSVSLGGLQGMVFGRFRPLSIQGATWNITQELVHQPIKQPDKGSSNSGLL